MPLHPDMGFPEEDPEVKKLPIFGISPPRTPLRSISTRPPESGSGSGAADGGEDEERRSTAVTPTAKEARIQEQLRCPPAPRKRRSPRRCRPSRGVEFFSCPQDLEAVFVRRPDKASEEACISCST